MGEEGVDWKLPFYVFPISAGSSRLLGFHFVSLKAGLQFEFDFGI